MGWQIKLKTHSGFHDLFDVDMSKSTNTVVYFDWKTAIYILELWTPVWRMNDVLIHFTVEHNSFHSNRHRIFISFAL
jgi:hypothetical protein